MPFNSEQVQWLRASLRLRHVKRREVEGKVLHYVEGWHVVAEANRIFGFDAWDRETVSSECVWRTQIDQQFAAAYLTRVRVKVRAGDSVVSREGVGCGEAIASTPGQAHERASKAAETDATKRALSTFGNSFGLSLYRDKTEPPKSKRAATQVAGTAAKRVVSEVSLRMRQADRAPSQMPKNAAPVARDMIKSGEERASRARALAGDPIAGEAIGLATAERSSQAPGGCESGAPDAGEEKGSAVTMMPVHLPPQDERKGVDKSVLFLSEPKRRRNREHLRFVARQPCLVCARTPSQAHHLRIAQPRALGRKVSDEFTVPLCALHHHDLHTKGAEAEWWWGHSIDPMPIAERLWQAHGAPDNGAAAE